MQGAISARADEVFSGLDREAQAALSTVFQALISLDEETGAATRKRALKASFAGNDPALRLIEAFSAPDARLLTADKNKDGDPVIEVAHEALLRHWEKLTTWIEGARFDLELIRKTLRDAKTWAELLPRDPALAKAMLPSEPELLRIRAAFERVKPPGVPEYVRNFIRHEWEWLLDELNQPQTDHNRRFDIGEKLWQMPGGEPRPGVVDFNWEEDYWCPVPKGEFQMGSDQDSDNPKRMEKIDHDFWIARYPITWAQFKLFLDDPKGYEADAWWQDLHPDALQYRDKSNIQNWKVPNRPVERVNWYDAMAFCRWLDAAWKAGQGRLPAAIPSNYVIRLPLETEWEKAAAWEQEKQHAREWPFGDTFDSAKCNTGESRLSKTTAVGLYPHGMSPCGALDMSGNVWEWCLNEYESGQVNIGSNDTRGLRGGDWSDNRGWARAACRSQGDPGDRGSDFSGGFRVVVAPVSL